MAAAGWSRHRLLGIVLLSVLLGATAVTVPAATAFSRAAPSVTSSGATLAATSYAGGPPVTELLAVYNSRPDLQAAFPSAQTNVTNYSKLVNWADGVVTNQWVDGDYPLLAPFGYYYVLMATYNARADLQAAFPNAYTSSSHYDSLVSWAGGVITGASPDGAYPTLAPYGYWYALMTVYNSRSDLKTAYPHAYTNTTSLSGLVSWAGWLVSSTSSDSAYSTLAPFGYYYALMETYSNRADLQAAYPNAFTTFSSFTSLVNWAEGVVTGQWSDGSYSTLAPFGYYYALMGTYNGRSDLQGAFPDAYTVFSSYEGLVRWASGVVTGASSDGAYTTLRPFGYRYAVMGTYYSRADLQAAFPYAFTSFTSYVSLINWAAWVSDTSGDGAYSALAPFGYYYNLMWVWDGRLDLQTTFPNAFTDWAEYQGLALWAGEVVNGTIIDPNQATLQPFGYWFALFGLVYQQETSLQSTYPDAWTDGAMFQGLYVWADEVVNLVIISPAYLTLLPFAGTYDALG